MTERRGNARCNEERRKDDDVETEDGCDTKESGKRSAEPPLQRPPRPVLEQPQRHCSSFGDVHLQQSTRALSIYLFILQLFPHDCF